MHARGRIPKSIATAMATGTREKGSGRSILNSVDPIRSHLALTEQVHEFREGGRKLWIHRVSPYFRVQFPGGGSGTGSLPTLGSHRRLACLTFHRPESCRYHANGDFPRFIMQRIRTSGVGKAHAQLRRRRMNGARLEKRGLIHCARDAVWI